MSPPLIETARLRLRPLTRGDVDDLHRLWVEPGVRRHLWDGEVVARERVVSAVEESAASFESRGHGLWAVTPAAGEALIGFCGFWFFREPPQLELLYGVAPAQWNRGFATEAARAVLKYGFEELAFERIEASTDAANAASARVLEKAGMSFRKRELTDGLDTLYYAVTREAFRG
jgi:ribosomal-protein-alanine N-acetyltransferase